VPATPVGAHVGRDDPFEDAAALDVDCVQIFLTDPQSWKKPPEREDARRLRDWDLPVYVHAPYPINVCSPKNNVRYGSRKILQQTCDAAAAIGTAGVIVHAGHAEDDLEEGFGRWVRTLELLETDVPLLIENTAGGDNAVARRFDALARLWDTIADKHGGIDLGFCFDTCHAHAAGEDMEGVVGRVTEIVGAIDLLHANDSRDPAGTGADRHANLGQGEIPVDLLRAAIRDAGPPIVVETPGGLDAMGKDVAFVRESLAD
jgi:deoxyribonuclease IV